MQWIFSTAKAPSRIISPISLLCESLQQKLVEDRINHVNCGILPRSTMVDGRFILNKELFPDYVEYHSIHDLIMWKIMAERHERYNKKYLNEHLPVRKLDMKTLLYPPEDSMQATWLGHSTVLSQWDGWNVLTDPIFSDRCSPCQLIGPKRVRPPPAQADELPQIDVCVISHNHYDHLDLNSVVALATAHPDLIWVVPLGMKEWMAEINVANVIEMDWSEKITIKDVSGKKRPPLAVQCVPCQHWCARTYNDRNRCLWASWAVFTTNGSFFFGGDTGYCSIFKQVGQLFPSGISLAALPIGAYGSDGEKWFHRPNHLDPAEAVQTHLDLNALTSLGVHWGTFLVTGEPIMEPPELLEIAKKAKGVEADRFIVMQHGETRSIPLSLTDHCK